MDAEPRKKRKARWLIADPYPYTPTTDEPEQYIDEDGRTVKVLPPGHADGVEPQPTARPRKKQRRVGLGPGVAVEM